MWGTKHASEGTSNLRGDNKERTRGDKLWIKDMILNLGQVRYVVPKVSAPKRT